MIIEKARQAYDPTHYGIIRPLEDRHFWFRARNRVIGALLRQMPGKVRYRGCILEAGCGSGNTLRVIEKACPGARIIGMDLFQEGLNHARGRTAATLVRGDVRHPAFRCTFDLVCLFDTLEHIGEDENALREIAALLKPGGVLFLTVPAGPSLWSSYDVAAGHVRRYTRRGLERLLHGTGFRIDFITPFLAFLYPLLRVVRTLGNGRVHASGANRCHEMRVVPGLNELFEGILAAEIPALRRHRELPLGTSLLAIARGRGGCHS